MQCMLKSLSQWRVAITLAASLAAIGWLLATQVFATGDAYVRWCGSIWSVINVAVILAVALVRYRFQHGFSVRIRGLRLPVLPNYTLVLENVGQASPLWSVLLVTGGAILADAISILAHVTREHDPKNTLVLGVVLAIGLSVNAAVMWVPRLVAAEIRAERQAP